MKKIALLAVAAILVSFQCDAQNNLSNLFKKAASAVTKNTDSSSSSILNTITSLIANNKVDEFQIAGNWNYSGAAISFKSENALSNIAGTVAEGTIEKKIDTYLNKLGIKPNAFKMNFASDGTVQMTVGSKRWNGTWTYEKTGAQVTLKFAKLITIRAYVAISGGELKLLFEANGLLKLVKSIASVSSNTTISALSSVLNSYNELYAGFRMTK
ncbi:MAG: DUF4923 family protein [Bacteroidales bacterium]|nr:DUF4923 family protein [Candidatus Cacconaster merdequi]